jgi:hypothetical protein
MLTILILLNIITITTLIITLLLYKTRVHKSRQLFERAWQLELTLISIYDQCPPEVKFQIGKALDNIKELD